MSRIAGILAGAELRLLNRLAEANAAATLETLRMAAAQRILAPRDGPSTFVALSRLQADMSDAVAATANVTAASADITQAQTAIDAIRTQLDTIRTELLKDPSEQGESQEAIDAAVAEVNTLAATTIGGRRLLDGSADFVVTGRNASQVRELKVYAKLPGTTAAISGSVTQAATRAQLVYAGHPSGHPTDDATFTLTGKSGSASFSVTTSQTLDQVAASINAQSHVTGVTASVAGTDVTFASVDYGSSAAISISVTSGTFSTSGTGTAVDAQATINGRSYTGSGNRFTVGDNGFTYELEFAGGFSGAFAAMTVSGDALRYQLSSNLTRPAILAISGLQASRLGGLSGTLDQIATGGAYSGLGANTSQAIRIVDEALADLDQVEGNVGGFFNAAITTASDYLSDLQTNLSTAIAQTDGYDEAESAALLARNRQLADNALAGLSILYQQRAGVVSLLQQIAGLTS